MFCARDPLTNLLLQIWLCSSHPPSHPPPSDPVERLALSKKEFGEWGGVNAAIEASTTFTGKPATPVMPMHVLS